MSESVVLVFVQLSSPNKFYIAAISMFKIILTAALLIIPTSLALASDAASLVGKILEEIINPAILVLMALALVVFIYGIFRSFAAKSSEDMRTRGKSIAIWGIVGLFIMVGVFGIMSLVIDTVGADDQIQVGSDGQIDIIVPDVKLFGS